jgi:hypothetical protein
MREIETCPTGNRLTPEERFRIALMQINDLETQWANATVRKMAKIAREALNHDDNGHSTSV